MADESKKLTTAEILAAARAQAGGGKKDDEEKPAAEPAAEESAPPSEESAPSKPATPATPTSTADILAAARAQASAGGAEENKPAKPPAPKKPAAGAAAPTSTADILAAARAQAKGEAPAASAPDAGAKKPAAKKAAAPVPAGDLPPVADMIKAVKGEGKPAGPPVPAKPQIPQKPPARAKVEEPPRRNFLVAMVATPFALAWTLLGLSTAWFSLYLARFMMPNVLIEPPSKFKVGPPSDYAFGMVATQWKSQFGVWIVHNEYKGKNIIYALISVCTHLGCTPNWLEAEQKFKCPCHGSGFYKTGINFEGPAPRPLERAGISLAADGSLEVDKSVKFQEEMGQWQDPTSYVQV